MLKKVCRLCDLVAVAVSSWVVGIVCILVIINATATAQASSPAFENTTWYDPLLSGLQILSTFQLEVQLAIVIGLAAVSAFLGYTFIRASRPKEDEVLAVLLNHLKQDSDDKAKRLDRIEEKIEVLNNRCWNQHNLQGDK